MMLAQNEYEKIVKAMADKGVPQWVFELLADLRHSTHVYIFAERINEMKKVYCIRCCFRDKHGDLDSVTKLNFGLFEDKKVAQIVVDALNRPLKDSWELKRKGEIENIELKHKQWSPDNAEVFYEVVG